MLNKMDFIYLFLLIFTLLGLFSYLYLKKIRPFQQKRRFEGVVKLINPLYANTEPYHLSIAGRKNFSISQQQELVYGEVDIFTLLSLLQKLSPQPNQVFYDLGSGSGKAVIAAKLCFPQLIVKAIELIPELHQLSMSRWNMLVEKQPKKYTRADINFICADFLNYDFSDADIIFINATSFSNESMTELMKKFEQLKKGTKILIISKTLPHSSFKECYAGSELMSWGFTTTRLYEKITP
jgi:predicted RNA methylase